MISIRCPHCGVGLKIDESKLPKGITSFKCPKCKHDIPLSILYNKGGEGYALSGETEIVLPRKTECGRIRVLHNNDTPEQVFPLKEGISIIGRQSAHSPQTDIQIQTNDRSMSREHLRIEVKKDLKGGYKHYLSDNNSKNHTLYNSNYLAEGEVVILNNNDEIEIGHTILRFEE
jgi:predicted Zn finger-like uncharacterized protein